MVLQDFTKTLVQFRIIEENQEFAKKLALTVMICFAVLSSLLNLIRGGVSIAGAVGTSSPSKSSSGCAAVDMHLFNWLFLKKEHVAV